jgi:hypothetical protein
MITVDTHEEAARWFGLLIKFYEVAFANLYPFIAGGRPGEPIDPGTNMIEYWPPDQIRERFRQACVEAQTAESPLIELQRIGKAGRLDLIDRIGAQQGFTAAGRRRIGTMERETYETENGRVWVLACISDDTATLRRLGAFR